MPHFCIARGSATVLVVVSNLGGRAGSCAPPATPQKLKHLLDFTLAPSIVRYVPNNQLDRLFQALADGTRRALVERLVRGPASVGELARPLAMSLPAVMQHLQVLEACGLVRSEKVGRVRSCRIEPAGLRTAESWLAGRRTAWEQQLDRLGDVLAEPLAAAERSPERGPHENPEQEENR